MSKTKQILRPRFLVFLLSSLASVVLVGLGVLYFIERREVSRAGVNLEAWANLLARQADDELTFAQQDLELLAQAPAFQSLPYVDRIDKEIHGVPENVDVEKRQSMTLLIDDGQHFDMLFVLWPNGDVYLVQPFQAQTTIEPLSLADKPYYQEAARTGSTVISDPLFSAAGKLTVVILVPIRDDSGAIIGYLGGSYRLGQDSLIVSAERIRPFDLGFIVDRQGFLVAHTDTSLLSVGVRERFVDDPLIAAFRSARSGAAGRESGSILLDNYVDPVNGKRFMAVLVPLRSGWSLGLLRERASALREAPQQGTSLTPFGAEIAGNRDGTIPAYTGGLPVTDFPKDFQKGSGHWADPFPDEKPLFSITSKNMGKYADKLSKASKALLLEYPSYRMDIYPSHRSVAYPAWVLDNMLKNAANAYLTRNGLAVEGAVGGIPFPVPKNGYEAMWNHMLVYNGYPGEYHGSNWYVDSSGRAVNSGALRVSLQSKYYTPGWDAAEEKKNGNSFFEAAYDFTAPPNAIGNAAYSIDTLDPVEQPRRAWSYSATSGQIQSVPDYAYDTPIASQGGITTYDEGYLALGKLDMFDFKLIGKQEMYIPYNNYSLVFQSNSAQILIPNHLNPDFVRWELHRVWVVEATLKPGKSHSISKRIFYFDEDWSGGGMSDAYGRNDQLIKGMFMAQTPLYDAPMPLARCYWAYDLIDNRYALLQHFGDPGMGYWYKTEGFPPETFSPDALPNRGS